LIAHKIPSSSSRLVFIVPIPKKLSRIRPVHKTKMLVLDRESVCPKELKFEIGNYDHD
jgi:hypothetical protein